MDYTVLMLFISEIHVLGEVAARVAHPIAPG